MTAPTLRAVIERARVTFYEIAHRPDVDQWVRQEAARRSEELRSCSLPTSAPPADPLREARERIEALLSQPEHLTPLAYQRGVADALAALAAPPAESEP